jgi:hypothetical protein
LDRSSREFDPADVAHDTATVANTIIMTLAFRTDLILTRL